MKRILIAGKDSYIGSSLEAWLGRPEYAGRYQADTVDMRGEGWKSRDFSGYDTVFHVAGIAHRKETKQNASLYYEVNRDLAIMAAEKAREEGVRQFILLSSMNVYGKTEGIITKDSVPAPKTNYGRSKLEADIAVRKMEKRDFKAAILRPPMVYGKDCKGNYPRLAKLARIMPVFPDVRNRRSMIYIENLCDFVEGIIRLEQRGIFHPQNKDYICTSDLMKKIAFCHGHKIIFVPGAGRLAKQAAGETGKKVFGTLIYDMEEDRCARFGLEESIMKTECQGSGGGR